jgi:hypothetical protein
VEVHAGTNTPVANPNGLLEPGEALRFELTLSFDPPVGSPASWTPPPGSGSGIIAGLGYAQFHFQPLGDAAGTWSHLHRAASWTIGVAPEPQPAGDVNHIALGQVPAPGSLPDPANPIQSIFHGVWQPTSYTARTVNWRANSAVTGGGYGLLYAQYIDPATNQPALVGLNATTPLYHLPVHIIPSPATGLAILLASPLLCRRRRAL